MAQALRKAAVKEAEVSKKTTTRLRLVTDNSRRKSVGSKAGEEMSARRLFVAVVSIMVIFVLVGLGPVIVNAEATRASQSSIVIKRDINRAMAELEQLELERSMLRSSVRIADIAQNQLGMVPLGEDFMTIDLGTSSELALARQQNMIDAGLIDPPSAEKQESGLVKNLAALFPQESAKNMLSHMAELTLGEASTLLVGDISLASWR